MGILIFSVECHALPKMLTLLDDVELFPTITIN